MQADVQLEVVPGVQPEVVPVVQPEVVPEVPMDVVPEVWPELQPEIVPEVQREVRLHSGKEFVFCLDPYLAEKESCALTWSPLHIPDGQNGKYSTSKCKMPLSLNRTKCDYWADFHNMMAERCYNIVHNCKAFQHIDYFWLQD